MILDAIHDNDADLLLGIDLPAEEFSVPESIVEDGVALTYTVRPLKAPRKLLSKTSELGNRFLGLVEGDDGDFPKRVVQFAKRYGVLSICQCGKPATHFFSSGLFGKEYCRVVKVDRRYSESLERWRAYSSVVRSLVRLIYATQVQKPGASEDWRVVLVELFPEFLNPVRRTPKAFHQKLMQHLVPDNPIYAPAPTPIPAVVDVLSRFAPKTPTEARFILRWALNRLLAMSDLSISIDSSTSKTRMRILPSAPSRRILSVVTLHLAQLASKSAGVSLCADCQRPFFLDGFQSAYRNAYCGNCSAGRAASRNYRQKNRLNPDRARQKRLSDPDAAAIRQEWKRMKERSPKMQFYRQQAEKYGVSVRAITKVISRESH